MPEIKETPKGGKPKARSKTALLPRQAGRVMKEKYLRQLDQRPDGAETGGEYATEQVESGGRWAVDELAAHRPVKERREHTKTAPATAKPEESAAQPNSTPTPEAPANPTKERRAVDQHPDSTPKERPTAHTPVTKPDPDRSAQFRGAQRRSTLNNTRRGSAALHQPTTGTGPRSVQYSHITKAPPVETSAGGVDLSASRRAGMVKERTDTTAATVKSRANLRAGAKVPARRPTPKFRTAAPQTAAKQATRKARQTAQRHMTRQMVTQARKAAKSTAIAIKRVAVAVTKAAAALVSSMVGLLGGGFLLIALVVVIIIAAVANSPFGLFFAAEPNAPETVSVAEAVAQVNMAYNAKLEELQAGSYDSIIIVGQVPDWPDVLAVFATKAAGADADGVDVATLDTDRVDKLKAVFWDMTIITSYVETIDHPGDGEDDPGWTEYILHITITAKTADEMRTAYHFTDYQNSALDELLADRAALSSLAGSLTITNADVSAVLDALPADLSPERREAVRTALTLVGKVGYFWGGKSYAIGWDSRWGTLQMVWANGNSTTGTYRPYGLDCSGFVDWIFNNSMGYIIGHGGGVIMQHTYCTDIPWSEAQPGDLAFFPDDSHIGIVVGRSADGGILICHCSSGQNNVVVTDCAATGFTAIGRPGIYGG